MCGNLTKTGEKTGTQGRPIGNPVHGVEVHDNDVRFKRSSRRNFCPRPLPHVWTGPTKVTATISCEWGPHRDTRQGMPQADADDGEHIMLHDTVP